jgi:hypothetical protein
VDLVHARDAGVVDPLQRGELGPALVERVARLAEGFEHVFGALLGVGG